jgi:PKD repeat protein
MKTNIKYQILGLFAVLLLSTCALDKIDDLDINNGCLNAPVAAIASDKTGGVAPCIVTFTNSTTGASSYQWAFGDGSASSEQAPPAHTFTAAGTYQVQMIATSTSGCKDTAKVNIVVTGVGNITPVAGFTITNNGCTAGCTVTFTNTSTNATSYLWRFGDNTTATDQSPAHVYAAAGSYVVKLIATSSTGLKDSTMQTVTVAAAPIATWVHSLEFPGLNSIVVGLDQLANGDIEVVSQDGLHINQYRLNAQGVKQGDNVVTSLGDQFNYLNAQDFQKTTNGYIMAGTTHFNAGALPSDDFYALKLDADFKTPFQGDFYDLDDGNEIGYSICQRDDGGYVVCGNKSASNAGGGAPGMLLFQVNANFQKEGALNLFTTSPSNKANVIRNISGGYAIVGRMINPSTNSLEACFFRLDDTYMQVGAIKYLGDFEPSDLIDLNDGTFIILGSNGLNGQVIKITSNNTIVWSKQYGLTLYRGIISNDNNLIFIGTVDNASYKIALYKVGLSLGDLIWERANYQITGSSSHIGSYVKQTTDGGFLLGGTVFKTSFTESLVMKVDQNGNQ